MIGYAMCGSFCTHKRSLVALRALVDLGYSVQPILSESAYTTDTRFGTAAELKTKIEAICQREIIHTVKDAEPLGPMTPLDALIVAPCTGNTMAKVASGITDTAVTMTIKAHLRSDRVTLIALATNDALSQNLGNIARLAVRRNVFFVPMKQDDPTGKPHSLVAEFELIPKALDLALRGEEMRPMFL